MASRFTFPFSFPFLHAFFSLWPFTSRRSFSPVVFFTKFFFVTPTSCSFLSYFFSASKPSPPVFRAHSFHLEPLVIFSTQDFQSFCAGFTCYFFVPYFIFPKSSCPFFPVNLPCSFWVVARCSTWRLFFILFFPGWSASLFHVFLISLSFDDKPQFVRLSACSIYSLEVFPPARGRSLFPPPISPSVKHFPLPLIPPIPPPPFFA